MNELYLVILICNWSDFFATQKLVKTHYCGLVLGRLPHRSSSISCWGHAINWMQTVAVFIELLKWQNWSCSFMAVRVVEFSNGGYKNARFLPKNQPAQRIFDRSLVEAVQGIALLSETFLCRLLKFSSILSFYGLEHSRHVSTGL